MSQPTHSYEQPATQPHCKKTLRKLPWRIIRAITSGAAIVATLFGFDMTLGSTEELISDGAATFTASVLAPSMTPETSTRPTPKTTTTSTTTTSISTTTNPPITQNSAASNLAQMATENEGARLTEVIEAATAACNIYGEADHKSLVDLLGIELGGVGARSLDRASETDPRTNLATKPSPEKDRSSSSGLTEATT